MVVNFELISFNKKTFRDGIPKKQPNKDTYRNNTTILLRIVDIFSTMPYGACYMG